MKANELRIGNCVEFLGKPVKIKGIYALDKRLDMYYLKIDDYIDSKIIHFKPIPLTEEWLLKFGFELSKFHLTQYNVKLFKLNGYGVQFKEWESYYGKKSMDWVFIIHSFDSVKLEHVHQLQNLYFALTGEDLTVK